MKRLGLTTIVALTVIFIFMVACSDQKPTAVKTIKKTEEKASATTMTKTTKEARKEIKYMGEGLTEEDKAKLTSELEDLKDQVKWAK